MLCFLCRPLLLLEVLLLLLLRVSPWSTLMSTFVHRRSSHPAIHPLIYDYTAVPLALHISACPGVARNLPLEYYCCTAFTFEAEHLQVTCVLEKQLSVILADDLKMSWWRAPIEQTAIHATHTKPPDSSQNPLLNRNDDRLWHFGMHSKQQTVAGRGPARLSTHMYCTKRLARGLILQFKARSSTFLTVRRHHTEDNRHPVSVCSTPYTIDTAVHIDPPCNRRYRTV